MKPESVFDVDADVFCHFCVCFEFPERVKINLLALSLSAEGRACTRRNIRKPHQSSRRIHMAQATSSPPLERATPTSSNGRVSPSEVTRAPAVFFFKVG